MVCAVNVRLCNFFMTCNGVCVGVVLFGKGVTQWQCISCTGIWNDYHVMFMTQCLWIIRQTLNTTVTLTVGSANISMYGPWA